MDTLRLLSLKHLNRKGQEDVNALIEDGQSDMARVYLLGAIDGRWSAKNITDAEARADYDTLGLDSDEVCRLRQDRALYGD